MISDKLLTVALAYRLKELEKQGFSWSFMQGYADGVEDGICLIRSISRPDPDIVNYYYDKDYFVGYAEGLRNGVLIESGYTNND